MGRPCLFDRPMTAAERMRRYRSRNRLENVQPITSGRVTEAAAPAVTKPWRPKFDPRALVG
jgi:hypothetical protein